ncbi:hypothetical protein AB0H55_34260 [Streptomyces umbrinus]
MLVDRYGRTPIAAASGLTLLAAGIKSPSPRRLPRLGWNLGLVSGTAMITDAVPLATRAKNQGMADVSIAIAGATGGFSSGLVVSASGYPVLALTGGIRSPSYPRSPPVRAAGDPAGPVGGSWPPSPSTAPDTVVHVFARTSSARR